MPTPSPFEATNSWCYHFARYQAIPEILAMAETADSRPFRLVDLVKEVLNAHLTLEQQATKYTRAAPVRRSTGPWFSTNGG